MVRSELPTQQVVITYQTNTTNASFRRMSNFLKAKGIKNNQFMLVLYDPDLLNINPRDPKLPFVYKQKVFKECMRNFWYFIREVVRIPVQGGTVGDGIQYKLHRANLAMNFGFIYNWNMFLEIPRQNGKTVSALCWYLWVFLFGTRNSTMLFLNKKLEASKLNLQSLKDIRNSLPDYLRMNGEMIDSNGKKIKAPNSTETIANIKNNNRIKTAPAARNKALANNLGRGMTVPFLYFDEYAFIPFNYVIYACAAPAFSTASLNAKNSGAPYGMLITTTPGDLLTDEGRDAFDTKNMATPFSETWYDLSLEELQKIQLANTKSKFIYIKFNYKQLGRTEEYLQEMIKELKSDYAAVRREILLEWAESATDSPFDPEELDQIKDLMKSPVREQPIYKPTYVFKIFNEDLFYKKNNNPLIVGVDVAGGMSRDASAITIIDSTTTDIVAVFNCNFIPIRDLAAVIMILLDKFMPNAIVNIERNGGFGASLLQEIRSKQKYDKNLYYEIKDKIFEERFDGIRMQKTTKRVKIYGLDETHATRTKLMEILQDRVHHHKDKFHSEVIINELFQLTVKKNGRIEHCDNGHDDTIFSMLLALYVWYEGKDLAANFHIKKKELKRAEEECIDILDDDPNSDLVSLEREMIITEDTTEEEKSFNESQKFVNKKIKTHSEAMKEQQQSIQDNFERVLKTNPRFRKAYCQTYNVKEEDICDPDEPFDVCTIINSFYQDETNEELDMLNRQFMSITEER